MAKKKGAPRGRVSLDNNDLTNDTRNKLNRLDDVVSPYGNMMTLEDLSDIVDTVKAECGEDAKVSVKVDDYYGNHVDIVWYRPETDEEWAKRVEANKKRSIAAREQRKTEKAQKEVNERAELTRLQEKYKA